MNERAEINRGFSVANDYRRATVWFFKSSGQLTTTFKTAIDKGKTRRERYDLILKSLKCCGITEQNGYELPQYSESAKRC